VRGGGGEEDGGIGGGKGGNEGGGGYLHWPYMICVEEIPMSRFTSGDEIELTGVLFCN
jgi:hypothetical protein